MLSQSDGKGRWLYWGLLTHGSRRRFTDMGRAEMTDLEHFESWAIKTGAYQTVEAIARYRQYLENKRANEVEALRERVKDE